AACPSDAVRPSSFVCRSAAGDCDVGEACNGTSTSCPGNSFKPAGASCGSSTNTECNHPDTCDGSGTCLGNVVPNGTACSSDGYKKAGTGCDDHNACTTKEKCVSLGKDPSGNDVTTCGNGVASPGARECDGNPCTTNDSCNNGGQCVAGTAAAPVGTVCDDGNVCTTTDRCAIVSGSPKCVG